MKTILCTVGTSIAGGCSELARLQKQATLWSDDTEILRRQIAERLKQDRYDVSTAPGRIGASAELNSLHRLGLSEGDEVVLLATDTADGRACAETLSKIIEKQWRGVQTTVERIEGLQVRDDKKLRELGLTRFLQVVLRYVEDPQRRHGGELVLNPTGGFKGVVPFLTVIGMLFRVKTVYVFEFSEALIKLPPLPINFDLQLYRRARPAVAALKKEGTMPEERFYKLIPGFEEDERAYFQSLLEVDGTEVTLSPLAFTLAEMEESARKTLWLSRQAQEKLESLQGTDRKRLEAFLTRFANPVWRMGKSHRFESCELAVFGESKDPFRLAAIFQGERAYVCRLYRVEEHETYEAEFSKLRLKDFRRFDQFVQWTPPLTEDELDIAEQSELDQLRAQVQAFPQRIAEATAKLREQFKQLQCRSEEIRKEARESKAQIVSLQKQLTHAQRKAHAAETKASAKTSASGLETLEAVLDASTPPPSLKGTNQGCIFVRDKRKDDAHGVLVFQVATADGTWEGRLAAIEAQKLKEIRIGSSVRLRVAGVSSKYLQLALPRS